MIISKQTFYKEAFGVSLRGDPEEMYIVQPMVGLLLSTKAVDVDSVMEVAMGLREK